MCARERECARECFSPGGKSLFEPWKEVSYKRKIGGSREDSGEIYKSFNKRVVNRERRELGFSIFVDNLPVFYDNQLLRALFRKIGKVVDCFVPWRRRKTKNLKFGFVRFESKEDAIVAARKMNGCRILGYALKVIENFDLFPEGKEDNGVLRSNTSRRADSFFRDGRSFSDVAKNTNCGCESNGVFYKFNDLKSFSRKAIKTVGWNLDWFSRCCVGKLGDWLKYGSIESWFLEKGCGIVSSRLMGGEDVLIYFDKEEGMLKALNNINGWTREMFISLVKWSPASRSRYRTIWLRCEGVPLSSWNVNTFILIGALWGKVVRVDENSINFNNIQFGRVLVITDCSSRVDEFIDLLVDDVSHVVWVKEESHEAVGELPFVESNVQKFDYNKDRGQILWMLEDVERKVKKVEESINSLNDKWDESLQIFDKERVCEEVKHFLEEDKDLSKVGETVGVSCEDFLMKSREKSNGALGGGALDTSASSVPVMVGGKSTADVVGMCSADSQGYEEGVVSKHVGLEGSLSKVGLCLINEVALDLSREVGVTNNSFGSVEGVLRKTQVISSVKSKQSRPAGSFSFKHNLLGVRKSKKSMKRRNNNVSNCLIASSSEDQISSSRTVSAELIKGNECCSKANRVSEVEELKEAMETIELGKLIGVSFDQNLTSAVDRLVLMEKASSVYK